MRRMQNRVALKPRAEGSISFACGGFTEQRLCGTMCAESGDAGEVVFAAFGNSSGTAQNHEENAGFPACVPPPAQGRGMRPVREDPAGGAEGHRKENLR